MDADINGLLDNINRFGNCVEHNGKKIGKSELKTILLKAKEKGYTSISEIPNELVDEVLQQKAINEVKPTTLFG